MTSRWQAKTLTWTMYNEPNVNVYDNLFIKMFSLASSLKYVSNYKLHDISVLSFLPQGVFGDLILF